MINDSFKSLTYFLSSAVWLLQRTRINMPTVKPSKEKNKAWKTAAGGIPSCFSPLIRFQSHSNLSPVTTLIYQGRNCTWNHRSAHRWSETMKKKFGLGKKKQRNGKQKGEWGGMWQQCGGSWSRSATVRHINSLRGSTAETLWEPFGDGQNQHHHNFHFSVCNLRWLRCDYGYTNWPFASLLSSL